MIISNETRSIVKYKLDDSFWHPLNNHKSEVYISTFFNAQTKIKPTVSLNASINKISETKAKYALVIETSFFNEKTRKKFIQYKGISSMEFTIEDEEKDFIDLSRFYESNYNFMEKFILENSLYYFNYIEFHFYKNHLEREWLRWNGFYQ
ncbi:hypothetical protein [Pedobacter sp. R-06]|uniref:hypothetical protein n=1 Tax=Pedobacter sp. R-06 TaxID=3404051 RepID=UPI003CEBF06E